jgi:protein involved in polysaccharide export with SLBB domain
MKSVLHATVGLFFSFLFTVSFHLGIAQQSLVDFSSVSVDDMTDSQIESLLIKAQSAGYSESDLFQLAGQQGLSAAEISALGERVNKINSSRVAQAKSYPNSNRNREIINRVIPTRKTPTNIFGLDFFKNQKDQNVLSTLTNIPTPSEYVLGSGDELFIDIYGKSEQYYQVFINPDGNIVLENVGPIFVSGLTIDKATERIRQKLGKVYDDLNQTNSKTNISVSLGSIKTIQINVVGHVHAPGSHTVNSLATVFNALYSAGGVTETGTLREIKVYRNNRLKEILDAYDLIVNGKAEHNIRLENDDVIIVGPYTNRVIVDGEVKTPAIFELKENETLSDLLEYAGGFTETAYTKAIKLQRNMNGEKMVADVFEDQFQIFEVKSGDNYLVSQILNRFSNRVSIRGAVYRPGEFAISDQMTVKDLIERSEGLKGDAFLGRAIITRTDDNMDLSAFSFNLGEHMSDSSAQIFLKREDVLNILSIHDLKEERYVEIAGEVNSAGIYPFAEGMTIQDLLVLAGGFSEAGTGNQLEITRRNTIQNEDNFNLAEIIVLDLDKELSHFNADSSFELLPFDRVTIRRNPGFHVQKFAYVEGQVVYPGRYSIANQGERISDLLQRAGGVNEFAFIKGATLIRQTEFYDGESEMDKHERDLEELSDRLFTQPELLNESEKLLSERVLGELEMLYSSQEKNGSLSSFAKKERLKEIVQRNSLFGNVQLNQSEAIGIELSEILRNPGSVHDMLIEEGDILIIPKQTQTVRLRGKLLYPTTVRFEKGKSLKYFVNQAGGFDNRAKRRGTYVIYANGRVARTRSFLFFKFYPGAEPGAEIIVPAKLPKLPMQTSDILGITSGIASVALILSQIDFSAIR